MNRELVLLGVFVKRQIMIHCRSVSVCFIEAGCYVMVPSSVLRQAWLLPWPLVRINLLRHKENPKRRDKIDFETVSH